jgi:hypothetical protein
LPHTNPVALRPAYVQYSHSPIFNAFPACCKKVVKKPKRRFLKYSDIALLIIIKMADVALAALS